MASDPEVDFDGRFSQPDAVATPWPAVTSVLEEAEIFWVSTVRASGRPHVAPLLALWRNGAMYFCTGPDEQKARNLAHEPRCIVMTSGSNRYAAAALDVVIEGEARPVLDTDELDTLGQSWTDRFGPDWTFELQDGALVHQGGTVHMFAMIPTGAFAFSRAPYSQTAYRF